MYKSLDYLVRRGKAWLKRRLSFRPTVRPAPDVLPYSQWLAKRIVDRKLDYPASAEKNLFSILTPVFDPPAGFFRILGKSIFAQDHQDWQWVVVDNGCSQPDVLYLLERFARDPRVKLVRAPKPLGIIGGMRLALEHASGRYVCAVDHDDRLYPDALRIVAAYLQAFDRPKIAYSDEDKLLPDGAHACPFFKPDWDPLLFLNCCYVAHLGIMERKTSLDLGVYSDPLSEGTPDGDAFCRFIANGYEPLHIVEVLYSWRMHPQSTALLGVAAKPYVTSSQKHAYAHFLEQRGIAGKIEMRTNPGIPGAWRVAPAWHALTGRGARTDRSHSEFPVLIAPGAPSSIKKIVLERLALCKGESRISCLESRPEAMLEALLQFSDQAWVCLLDSHYLPLTTDFFKEFDCLRQAIPDSVVIGGIILDSNQRIESAGMVWGFNGILGSPLAGEEPIALHKGAGALAFQRSTTAVSHRFVFANVGFLRFVVHRHQLDSGNPLLPAWLAAYAQVQGKRILFSPYVRCQALIEPIPRQSSSLEESQFISEFGTLLPRDRYYSPFLGLMREHAYDVVRPDLRAIALNKYLGILTATHPDIGKLLVSADRYASPLSLAINQFKASSKFSEPSFTSQQLPITYSRQPGSSALDSCRQTDSLNKSQPSSR